MTTCNIIFQPDGIRVSVERGTLLSDAMDAAGIMLSFPCGRTGTCGKCAVETHPTAPEPNDFDRRFFSEDELARCMRLACMAKVDRDLTVLISPGVRVHDGTILVDGVSRSFHLAPCIKKTYLELPSPSLNDQVSDMNRLTRELELSDEVCPAFDIELARSLPSTLRDSEFRVTAVRFGDRISVVEPGDTTGRLYGIAFDIGTTTVAGAVFDLTDGRELAHASRLNTQVVFGEDAISRIKHVMEHLDGSRYMAEKIRTVANDIINEASAQAGISSRDIYEAVFVGNTTMSHLFLGLDPSGLSQIPFVPVTGAAVNLRASDLGIIIHPQGAVSFLPNIAGFVGSDTVAVMLACDYLEGKSTRLAVDVGTNGELALRHGDSLFVCSTAAGPAFEGATLSCGMRAAPGAIEHVRSTSGGIEFDIIGGGDPSGICGSGIIDLIAVLLSTGIIDETGRILDRDELAGTLPGNLVNRLVTVGGEPAFLIHRRTGGTSARDIVLTQRDVRQIQLAKGAIRAGINLLLAEAGLEPGDLEEILLAGAFGNYIGKMSAVRIGLLPDIGPERIRFIGNAALTGAKMALLSRQVRADADRIRKTARHVELAALPGFTDEFAGAMVFPKEQS
ncbi:ASKHA domain-containing protein [Candidatus Latescibacterota bacterium]